MRCSCQICGTYMVHSEGPRMGCVCPDCQNRCAACLGTDTVISREALRNLRNDPFMLSRIFSETKEIPLRSGREEY